MGGETILVTGGTGYIGSHTVVELVASGYKAVIFDNLVNSSMAVMDRLKEITGKPEMIEFVRGDCNKKEDLEALFATRSVYAVIHFAALKAVGESVQKPLLYYQNNIVGALNLMETMEKHGVTNIVFSSSATVYGEPKSVPVDETLATGATNPYGRTKLCQEDIMSDMHVANPKWNVVLLRYFNPVGAHPSGRIGENPKGIPNNLMPFIQQVAVGKRDKLTIFGNDWPTPDGTGVRDFIHVVDLAKGHIAALKKVQATPDLGSVVYNLGTGSGLSVIQLCDAFERASGKPIKREFAPRRAGDVSMLYCAPTKAKAELGWTASLGVDDMCRDSWNWISNNPDGYPDA